MKQYDLYMGESGGKEEKKSHLNEVITKMLDEAYNVGIDQAIQVVIQGLDAAGEMPHMATILQTAQYEIISKLRSLKKPTV